MTSAWVVRTGKYGERDAWALAGGITGGGWDEIPDLTRCQSRGDVQKVVDGALPNSSAALRANYTGQLWALRGRIEPGDIMALPLKTTGEVAIGRVTHGYAYQAEETDPSRRHVIRVEWAVTDLPRSAIKEDLRFTLGSALTIFAPSRGHAVERLEVLMATRTDPGQLPYEPSPSLQSGPAPSDDVDEPENAPNIAEQARDQILTHISETFTGHQLTALVSAVLEAEGFVCEASTGGADGGVDIVAGSGILGMDSPKLIVQVKSGGQVSDSVVRDLLGTMHHVGAEQGLLVAWDGVSGPARQSLQRERFRVRLWNSLDVLNAVLRTYEKLPEEIRTDLPLQRVWLLAK